MTTENDLRNGQAIYVYSQKNEGKAKTTEDLILIDIIDASEYDEIRRCPKEVQKELLFVGFKGVTDFIFDNQIL
jgi:hypothetical protein